MPEGHLSKKNKEYENLKNKDIQDIFIKINFQHDMAYGGFENLPRREASDKAFSIVKDLKCDAISVELFYCFRRFLIKALKILILILLCILMQLTVLLKVKLCQTNI